jgi:hypothetical protein
VPEPERLSQNSPKSPWLAWMLLVVTCGTFGWIISSRAHVLPIVHYLSEPEQWLLLGVWVGILGAIATYPTKSIQMSFTNLFSPNLRALVLILGISIIGVVMLTWTEIFVDSVVLMAAGLLLSLDLKLARWSKIQRLFTIVCSQLLGFYVGIGMHQVSIHPEYLSGMQEYLFHGGWYRHWRQFSK